MSKLKMHTPDLVGGNIAWVADRFPGCVTESRNEKGEVVRAVDFDRLRQELSAELVEGPRERYHLDWPGKREALLAANSPIAKTLRPCREESVDFDTTRNLFIEGDNLDALKLLQETYLNKVKMIYIDPPYNTGRNLLYKNDYSQTTKEFLERSMQRAQDGSRLVANTESNGRFHSNWLSMIYPRLRLARQLLARDGVLVCAIDENEVATLAMVLKEIFGEGSYEHAQVTVVHNPRGQQGKNISYVHEYALIVYPADKRKYLADFAKDSVDSRNLRDSGTESDRKDARNCFYPFIVKDDRITSIGDVPADSFHPVSSNVDRKDGSIEVWPMTDSGDEKKWRYARQSVDAILPKLESKSGRSSIQIIFNKDTGTMRSVWTGARYDASEYGTKLLESLIEDAGFTFPKSLWTVYDSVRAVTEQDKDAVVMDFFAGSSTTAHAIMQLNADDGGNRQFIMVQFPEPCDAESSPYRLGLKTIADISKERIRRVRGVMNKSADHATTNLDTGFRVCKVDSSNMKDIYYRPDEMTPILLSGHIDNIKDDRTDEDLLFQILLDWGVDLTLPITKEKIAGKPVYFVDTNVIAACFADGVDDAIVKKLADRKPLRAVFRDTSYGSDDVKINVEQIFKQFSPGTKVKTL